MVKIDNIFGDIKKGCQDNAIYQTYHGKQIRRARYKEEKEPSKGQLNQRNRFKNAVKWLNGLSSLEKSNLKEYYKKSFLAWTPGQPSTWYNWAKTFYLSSPQLIVLDETTNKYQIKHPSIFSVSEYDLTGQKIYSVDGLSNIINQKFTDVFSRSPNLDISKIIVETLTGEVFEFGLKVNIPEVITVLDYELVDEKDIPAESTEIVFDGLDGDSAGEYLIEGYLTQIPVGASSYLYVKPNSANSTYRGNRFGSYYGVTSVGTANISAGFLIAVTPVVETYTYYFRAFLVCLEGKYKHWHCEDTGYGNTRSGGGVYNVVYHSTDNITSLKIEVTNGSFNGHIRLLKRIKIQVEK